MTAEGSKVVTDGSSIYFLFIVYLLKHVMILTREEKERFVLDLYNQGKSTREIAEEARMSFRHIGAILDKAEEEKESEEEQTQQKCVSTQAYNLFLQGKTPVQVAIALNIREPEATQYYKEYWKLVQHHSLNRIYEEIRVNISSFVNLHIPNRISLLTHDLLDNSLYSI